MTVKELIDCLQDFDGDMLVFDETDNEIVGAEITRMEPGGEDYVLLTVE